MYDLPATAARAWFHRNLAFAGATRPLPLLAFDLWSLGLRKRARRAARSSERKGRTQDRRAREGAAGEAARTGPGGRNTFPPRQGLRGSPEATAEGREVDLLFRVLIRSRRFCFSSAGGRGEGGTSGNSHWSESPCVPPPGRPEARVSRKGQPAKAQAVVDFPGASSPEPPKRHGRWPLDDGKNPLVFQGPGRTAGGYGCGLPSPRKGTRCSLRKGGTRIVLPVLPRVPPG
jgi:hypothetical protein